jgi:hypothetical protein
MADATWQGDPRPMAVVDWTQETIAERFGLVLERGVDDLAEFQAGYVGTSTGRRLLISRYGNDPNAGWVVYADSWADPAQVIGDLRSLGLQDEEILWAAE